VMVGHNTIATVFEKVTAHSIGANGSTEDMLLISLQSSREDPTGSVMWETTFEVNEQYGTRHALEHGSYACHRDWIFHIQACH